MELLSFVFHEADGFQGLKLRDVIEAPETCSLAAQISWASPVHPTAVMDLTTLSHPHRYPATLRMSYFDCNAPGTTGYSVATNGVSITTIHVHGQDHDTQFYNDVDSTSNQWIYMPIDRGEYLTDICRQNGFRHGKIPSPRLMVRI